MRALSIVVVAGCAAASPPPPVTAPQTPPPQVAKTCVDAAVGFTRATIAMHAPDADLAEPVRLLCSREQWSTAAIDCFAQMGEDDLATCSKQLRAPERDALYRELAGTGEAATVEVTRARLATIEVGVAECDQFVAEVSVVMTCDRLPLEQRVSLGTQTVELWDLPKRLTGDVYSRMARVCGESLASLKQAATSAGCMP